MPKTTSINLGDHFTGFVSDLVAKGRYGSASEVVREGLRLIEEQEQKREALRRALLEGEESGTSERTPKEVFRGARERLKADGKI
ncbi:MAG: type II toxin-antitoxin system ParD family antitoxin [Pseudomonadota bacterium]